MRKARAYEKCEDCGGSRTQHNGDNDGCWCAACMSVIQPRERCQEYRPGKDTWQPGQQEQKPLPENVVPFVGRKNGQTSLAMQRKMLPRMGSLRRQVYDLIMLKKGLTDDEIEQITMKSHQAVSAARNTLMNDGLVEDSGQRRKTRYDNEAIVWVAVPIGG